MLAGYVLHAVVPVLCLAEFALQRNHLERLVALLAWTYIHAVAATETVHNADLHAELHALELCWSQHVELSSVDASSFLLVHNEWADGSVRTNEGTLVTLDTVLAVPSWNEGRHTALLVSGCALLPHTVLVALVGRNGEEVTILCVDRTHELVDELWVVVSFHRISWKVLPCWVNVELLILTTAVNSSEVHVHHVFTLLAVRLHDSLLHLLHSEVNRNHLSDAEEC